MNTQFNSQATSNENPGEIRAIRCVTELEAVYRLTHDSYVSKAYVENQPNGLLLHYPEYDVIPETTVLGLYQNDQLMATVSFTVPGPFGYTIDRDFQAEITKLRHEGRSVCVIWRLVVKEECRSSRAVLMNLIGEVARRTATHGTDAFLIEVNPKHERAYQRLLNMTPISRKEGADGLMCAPAVLMRVDHRDLPDQWRLWDDAPKTHDPIGLTMLEPLLNPLPL